MAQLTKQRWLVILFCFAAALRVGIYSAAFPFFNNVDEEAHFDMVLKYSHGHIPHKMEQYWKISGNYISAYRSYEFSSNPWDYPPGKVPVPLWETNQRDSQKRFKDVSQYWHCAFNQESTHAPLYYSLAAGWLKIGQLTGVVKPGSLMLLYWIRFLNVIFIVCLVLLAYEAARITFPENSVIVWCTPLFAALLPQDTFYSIQSDVLSPLCFGLTFVSMVKFFKKEVPSPRDSFFVAISTVLTVLAKTSNLPALVIVLVGVAIKSYNVFVLGQFRAYRRSLLTFVSCLGILIFAWCAWNFNYYGDLTGSQKKIEVMGWARKPVLEWFGSGLFTAKGLYEFWTELMASFWRGEFVWSWTRMTMPWMDVFYWASSLLFLLASLIGLSKTNGSLQRQINYFTLFSFVTFILFMVFLSVSLSFKGSFYPSEERPYFTSGRLISGALIPFLILYLKGFEKLFGWIRNPGIRISLLVVVALGVTVSEHVLNRVAFASHFNFFHAPLSLPAF